MYLEKKIIKLPKDEIQNAQRKRIEDWYGKEQCNKINGQCPKIKNKLRKINSQLNSAQLSL